jgi:hypothetical protein
MSCHIQNQCWIFWYKTAVCDLERFSKLEIKGIPVTIYMSKDKQVVGYQKPGKSNFRNCCKMPFSISMIITYLCCLNLIIIHIKSFTSDGTDIMQSFSLGLSGDSEQL